ncbi:MAG: response regulator transcription factor [Rhodoluna sp.]|nr:response regulator transcription factor [Rhodoluna sp.]
MYSRHVVVVENEPLMRDLIGKTLESAGFKVTTAANAADAKRVHLAIDPDAMVIDIELGPGPDGFDLAAAVLAESPEIAIVFLTNLPDPRLAGKDSKSVPKNAAYLRKSNLVDANELVDALNSVLKSEDASAYRHDLDAKRPLAELSAKQLEVLKQISEGLSNQQIADARGTSVRAVEGMVSRIFEGLNIDVQDEGNSRVDAVKKFFIATRPGE